jgi:hypothetical protein
MCLFPFFVRFPFVFQRLALRRALFAIPRGIMRAAYEALYILTLASLYKVKSSWKSRTLMLARYIRNLNE